MLSGSWGPTINEKTNGGRNGGRAGGYVDCCSGCLLNPILSKIMEHDILLGDKMNLTVRLGKQFPGSSPCLPRQLGTGQQGRYTSGTLIKQFIPRNVESSRKNKRLHFFRLTLVPSAD